MIKAIAMQPARTWSMGELANFCIYSQESKVFKMKFSTKLVSMAIT
jgi:hypothetical protein